jgi:hypothetical protein
VLTEGGVLQFAGFRLDRQSRVLFRRDEAGAFVPIAVGPRALDVLDVLLDRAGNLVLRDAFMAAVWPATAVEGINLENADRRTPPCPGLGTNREELYPDHRKRERSSGVCAQSRLPCWSPARAIPTQNSASCSYPACSSRPARRARPEPRPWRSPGCRGAVPEARFHEPSHVVGCIPVAGARSSHTSACERPTIRLD